jgi:hypothetical protein
MRARPDRLSEHMSEVQGGECTSQKHLKSRGNPGWTTTYQVHIPHVVAYAMPHVEGGEAVETSEAPC